MKQEVVHGRSLQGGSGLLAGPVHLQRPLQSAETSRLLRERLFLILKNETKRPNFTFSEETSLCFLIKQFLGFLIIKS